MNQNDLEDYEVKDILSLCDQVKYITPFCSKTSSFRDTRVSKIRNAPNDLRITLSTCHKYQAYAKYFPLKDIFSVSF